MLVDRTGAFQPRPDSYSIHYFLYDRDARRLYSPLAGNVTGVRRSPMRWFIPAPSVQWLAGDLAFGERTYATSDTCYSQVYVRNNSGRARRVTLFVAAVPFKVTGAIAGSLDVRYDERLRAITVKGRPVVISEVTPAGGAAFGCAASDRTGDVTAFVREGTLPRSTFARGGLRRITSGAMRFDLDLKPREVRQLWFVAPIGDRAAPGRLAPRRIELEVSKLARQWRDRFRIECRVPDARVSSCLTTCIAQLVALSGNGRPVPGPTKYRAFWVRDCAYMADALYYCGQQDLVPPALDTIRAMQLPDGGFPPKLGAKKDDELDAPGEAIYALVQHYRRTRDVKWLREQWPCIEAACRYIHGKRVVAVSGFRAPEILGRTASPIRSGDRSLQQIRNPETATPRGRFESESLPKHPGSGIMPASVSAEDLGEKLRQHYWDDFWCVRGLRDAAYAARALGKPADARWMSAEADSLMSATLASIRETMAKHSIDYIPNGPDEVTSSAMARGTSCALWPCGVLDCRDTLTRASFEVYWRKWIEPSGGGFVHKGHYWPYAGLDLAQGYLMLGQRERAWKMLDWTLNHDPTGGFYAWPEGMSKRDLGLAEGDMPHGWMCAAYISLVRNMLVRETRAPILRCSPGCRATGCGRGR